jgi:hypothetical protein
MTYETITAALHNLQAQINETVGLMKDCAKQPTSSDTAANLVKYSIRLAQLEGAFLTLQEHAPGLVEVSKQYPMPPRQPVPVASPEEKVLVIEKGDSQTYDRVAQIHADTAAAMSKEEEE